MLRPYRQLLAVPHLASLLVWSVLARMHYTGTSIALTFLVVEWTDSYALAGLVMGALTVGNGVSGPWRGRMADRTSAPRLIVITVLCYVTGLAVLVVLPAAAWYAAPVIAFLAGLSMPPATQVVRGAFTRIEDSQARTAAYGAEATLFELTFMLGPVLTAFAVGALGPHWALGLIAVVALSANLAFAVVLRQAGMDQPAPRPALPAGTRRRSVLVTPGLALTLGASLFLVMAFTMVDLAIVALGRELNMPTVAGALIAVWAVGSLAGGLIAGGLRGQPRPALRTALVGVGMAALIPVLPPVLDPTSPVLIGLILAIGGLAIAPTISAGNQRIGDLAPEGRAAEAVGWMASFTTTGGALAAPLAGWLLDRFGPAAAAGGAAVVMVFATAMMAWSVTVVRRTTPAADQRESEASDAV
ncbi:MULTISPECIES: MFS transporter [unclassified Crossiella]|uniref:MFS transporter n=1 Tax=unclassified Crossiella TaxID=2620835 RepID=UPI002000171C|nr:MULTISPECIES: MFS transporter [unclassified Crossiella]MCK2237003.1 MFS transporter [Crossiella sp. S99.2]MCK2250671.1 MFS transporter [Crossiella sp. S99.1]